MIISATSHQRQWPDCYDMIKQFLGETDGAVNFDDIIGKFKKKKKKRFDGALQWSIKDWISILARGGGQKKGFNIVWIIILPDTFCVSEQSKVMVLLFIDPGLQDNVLLPKRFTEYICHVGNVSEMHFIIRSGLIPGEHRLKRGSQSVFFTKVNLVEDNCMEESLCDLTNPRIGPYKNIWKPHQIRKIGAVWNSLKRERGLQFYQTRSHAIVLYNTLLAACIEKVACIKTQDELYQKVRLTPRVPRSRAQV